jgi:nuclear protein localization protein 4
VQANAKPGFPADYLLMTLTHGFSAEEEPIFSTSNEGIAFPVENRAWIGVAQDIRDVARQTEEREDCSPFQISIHRCISVG